MIIAEKSWRDLLDAWSWIESGKVVNAMNGKTESGRTVYQMESNRYGGGAKSIPAIFFLRT